IDETLVDAVALGAPAILLDEHPRVDAPALVVALEAPQHAEEAAIERGDGDAVVKAGADIGDPHLQRRETLARADVPPELRCVLDEPGLDEDADMAAILAPALEALGDAGPRQPVEDADAVEHEAGVLAAPEGRGGGEREEMRQEVADLVHEVDAKIVV